MLQELVTLVANGLLSGSFPPITIHPPTQFSFLCPFLVLCGVSRVACCMHLEASAGAWWEGVGDNTESSVTHWLWFYGSVDHNRNGSVGFLRTQTSSVRLAHLAHRKKDSYNISFKKCYNDKKAKCTVVHLARKKLGVR